MPSLRHLLPALVPLLAAAPGAAAGVPDVPGPVVEEVVLVVGDRAVTRSDLELEARVALVGRGGVEAAFGPVDGQTMTSVADWLIHQMLLLEEVERLAVFEASDEEVARELAAFAGRFGSPDRYRAFLAAQDVAPERVAAIFRRGLRVERYLEHRVRLSVRVRDEEVEALAASAEAPAGASPEVLRGWLLKRRSEEAVARLVADLRERGRVRRLAPVEPVPGRGPAGERP